MARRSIRVTLSNNTLFTLELASVSGPCHGSWTDPWEPPAQILPRTHGAWQSESSGIATGTEGWVKYLIKNTDGDPRFTNQSCPEEMVYIHWDNPFVWPTSIDDPKQFPLQPLVATSNVPPPCDADRSNEWNGVGGTLPRSCSHELFTAGVSGFGPESVTWWDAIVNWPAIVGLGVIGDLDINLEFTLGLRALGSVDQTLYSFYDGRKGLRSLVNEAGQPSLRKLFGL
jgi:hypothetical protein